MSLNISKKKLIIFDLDGTLIDTKPIVVNILNFLRQERGLNKMSQKAMLSSLSLGGSAMIENTLETTEIETKLFLDRFRNIYSKIKTPNSLIYKNVPEALYYLEKNKYLIAICSNKPINLLSNALKDTNLSKFFNFIIGEDQKSSPKPDPERLIKCLSFFNLKNYDAVFIGDSTVDQIAAQNAKIDFILFQRGYNDGVDSSKLIYSMSNFEEIKNLF